VASLSQPAKKEEETKARSATRTVRKQAVFPPEDSISNPFSEVEFDPARIEAFGTRKVSKVKSSPLYPCFALSVAIIPS